MMLQENEIPIKSVYCMPETYTMLYVNCISIKPKAFFKKERECVCKYSDIPWP